MCQESKSTEREIARIAHALLEERYKDTKALWSLINGDSQSANHDFELPCEEHMFLAIALIMLDRLESIEKLLTPENPEMLEEKGE